MFVLETFLENILPECVDVSIGKNNLVVRHKVSEKEIT